MSAEVTELPNGWRLLPLGEVGRWGSGGTPKRGVDGFYKGTIPWLKIGDLNDGLVSSAEESITEEGLRNSSAKVVEPGTLLVAMYGSIGKLGIPMMRCATNQAIAFCVPDDHIASSDYLFWLLLYLRPELLAQGKGGTQPNISQTVLKSLLVPIPPRDTQREIVSLVQGINKSKTSVSNHLSSAQRAVERFRQAVLAAACAGRLTADWREEHDGDAHQLVQDLRAGSPRGGRPLAEPQSDLVDDVPPGWEVVTLNLLIDHIEAGKSFNALGRPAQDGEWGVIKVSAMSWGRFLEDENKAVPEARRINPGHEIRPGDLLLSRANTAELVGATVLVGQTRPHLLLSDKSLRLIPRSGIDKAWLNFTLGSHLVRSQFAERATGTSDSMRNLSQEKILATTLPLPPTAEQHEIAHRVDELFALADRLQQRIKAATRRVDRSSQAVLAKAFRVRGELTDGDGVLTVVAGGRQV